MRTVFLSGPSVGKTTSADIRLLFELEKSRCFRNRINLDPIIRWLEMVEGKGCYAKTKGKQPRTVFVRKRVKDSEL